MAHRFVELFFGRLDARTASFAATAALMAKHFPADYVERVAAELAGRGHRVLIDAPSDSPRLVRASRQALTRKHATAIAVDDATAQHHVRVRGHDRHGKPAITPALRIE